jgi:hypothetical protein
VVTVKLLVEASSSNPLWLPDAFLEESNLPNRNRKAAFSDFWHQIVKIMGLYFKGFFPCVWSIKCSLDQYKCNFVAGRRL